ncbi:MAG: hypothetical protein JXR94_11195 [Candidatus Hydrogenedentes bacterium]|nr:hypothetical protein [Candidatus Hydrogenedentota bacterium]
MRSGRLSVLARWTAAAVALVVVARVGYGAEPPAEGKRISPWFVYKNEQSIERLRPVADLIDSISVCGDAPATFVAECHALGMQVYKLVGGKPEAFDTEAHRQATIADYVRLCEGRGYDGIDLDFEGFDASLRDAYGTLMRDASRELHRRGKKLSICVSYMMSTRRTAEASRMGEFYDPAVIADTCDVVRVMCYDMYSLSGGAVGPVSTQPWAKDAMKYWMQHVPRERLVMGLPAYSGDFELAVNGAEKRVYSDPAPDVPEGTAVQRVWLPYEQVNSYLYQDADAHMHVYYASDAASTRAHLETAERLGITCIGFWHFEAVTPEMWDVVRTWHANGLADDAASWWLVFP